MLDDPLSALDQKVGTEIYNRCIREHLKDKCVILATHQVHLLEDAEKILVMDEGKIIERGSFNQIINNIEDETANEPYNATNPSKSEEDVSEDVTGQSVSNQEQLDSQDLSHNYSHEISYDLCNQSSSIMLDEIILRKKSRLIENLYINKRQETEEMSPLKRQMTTEMSSGKEIQRQKSILPILYESTENNDFIDKPACLKDWFRLYSFGIGNFWFFAMLLCLMISNFFIITSYYFTGKLADKSKNDQQESNLIYWVIGSLLLVIAFQITSVVISYVLIFTASRTLHNKMIWSLLRTKLEYFDKNTIGSILTKFSKDIAGLDDFVPGFTFVFIRFVTLVIATTTVICIAAPFLIIVVVISIFLLILVAKNNYLPGQKLEWLESEARGPLNTRFSSVLDGLVTIRAYKMEDHFMQMYYKDSDIVSSVALSHYGVNNWLYI